MRMHYLQHVSYESPANIEAYFRRGGHQIRGTHLYRGERLPSVDDLDCLVVMGGPMGIYDHKAYPWLVAEKEFIKACIKANKKVVGICLGAQLIADALGAHVYPSPYKEIGWLPIQKVQQNDLEEDNSMVVFHWHGDTFDLPEKAELMYISESGINQVYKVGLDILALQCHLEMKQSGVEALLEAGSDELIEGPYIQNKSMILENTQYYEGNERKLNQLLDEFLESVDECLDMRDL